jgi:hypothetical protein
MPAGTVNLTCDQGATFDRTIVWQTSGGQAINLTNYGGRMDVRFASASDADLLLSLTISNGRVSVSDASGGTFRLLISSVDTAALTAGEYYYDFEAFDNSSPPIVQRLIQGTFTVTAGVTT